MLCDVVSVLLLCMLDDQRLNMWPSEGMQMLKALNMLMMKILENCNRWGGSQRQLQSV